MATRNINLDTIYKEALHKPSVDGIALYARQDGTMEQEVEVNSTKSEKWAKESLSTYSSPNGIRRAFFTRKRVVVQYYKPYIKNNVANPMGCWRDTAIKDSNGDAIDIYDLGNKMLNYNQAMIMYNMSKQQLKQDVSKPDEIKISGIGLSALYKPWVCSNVEEIYFDASVLFSQTVMNSGFSNLLELVMSKKNIALKDNFAVQLVEQAVGSNIKNIRNRYPRLKFVALISNLEEIMQSNYDKGRTTIESTADLSDIWFNRDTNRQLVQKFGGLVIINKLTDITGNNKNFIIRPELYRFDSEVLNGFFESIKRHVSEETPKTQQKEEEQVQTVKSSLEVILDRLENVVGQGNISQLTKLIYDGYSNKEIEQEVSKMSTEGQKKYSVRK